MGTLLFVNACMHRERSRTMRLARALLERIRAAHPVHVDELVLEDTNPIPLDTATLDKRDAAIAAGDYTDQLFDYAHQFVEADDILVAAPYWDLSFPAVLKSYCEQLCVNGLTFSYSPEGIPIGHCKAKRLLYVTTAGGYLMDYNRGYDYIAALCKLYFGIPETRFFAAEGLDIVGNDPGAIMAEALERIASFEG